MQPRQMRETLSPVLPRLTYSILSPEQFGIHYLRCSTCSFVALEMRCCGGGRRRCHGFILMPRSWAASALHFFPDILPLTFDFQLLIPAGAATGEFLGR